MDSAQIRVLVVDGHDLFRTGMRTLLEEEQGFAVADAADGWAGIGLAGTFAPDVIVLDTDTLNMSSVAATSALLEAVPEASILMLTSASDEASVLEAIRGGASGYLLKDAPLPEIVAAIRATAAGHSTIGSRVAGHLLRSVRLSDAGHAYGLAPRLPVLSLRERDVLTLVTDGCGNSEIAGRLFVSPSTVKHHVAALLDKLGVDNRVQAATFATREGLGSLNVPFNETVNVRAIARTHHAKAGSAS